MKLHLDTSFLIEWQRNGSRIATVRDEILAGMHQVSYDPVVESNSCRSCDRIVSCKPS